ncbi:uncharacterized protein LOC125665757 [Ostrea edulis]|uniref:uncharacterized protein LOC125665757 n=1 Tax=Ostrea edulis TaxID=37623 RepID=UPI00209515F9|nr:uncharacterized protein LOC125665757 [Ostrea edulis]
MSRDELIWDHTGEDLDDPLIGSYEGEEAILRSRTRNTVQLSHYEALKLAHQLEATSALLRAYLGDFELSHTQSETSTSERSQSGCIDCLKRKCERVLDKVTGLKIIIFTVVLQGFNLLIQTLIDIWPEKDDYIELVVSCLTMILMQVLNLILLLISSVKLVKQLFLKEVSAVLLAQSYMAAILVFAGIYTLTKRLAPDSWKDVREDVHKDPALIIEMYCQFLYFSVSTATLCGTASVTPNKWYNYICVSIQMLLSFMYFASILGKVMAPVTSPLSMHHVRKNQESSRFPSVVVHSRPSSRGEGSIINAESLES